MNCDWCGREFNPKKENGVCPDCGGLHSAYYDESKDDRKASSVSQQSYANITQKTAGVSINNTPSKTTNSTNTTYAKVEYSYDGKGASSVSATKIIAILVILVSITIVGFVVYGFFENEETSVENPGSFEYEYNAEADDYDDEYVDKSINGEKYNIPSEYSQYVPTVPIIEDGVVYGIEEGDSPAVIVIPEGVTHIADGAFYDEYVIAVIFPESLESIGSFAFYDCYALEYAVLPDGLKEVYPYAFAQAGDEEYGIDFGEVPSSLEYVGEYGLITMLPTSGISQDVFLEKGAFNYSNYYENVDEDGFVIISDVLIKYIGSAPNVTIPDTIGLIDSYAFYENESVTSVAMNDSVYVIGDYAFFGMDSLTNVAFSANLQDIGEGAFSECNQLVAANLPEGLLYVGADAFFACENLIDLTIPSTITHCTDTSFSVNAWYYEYFPFYGNFIIGDGLLVDMYVEHGSDTILVPEGVKNIATGAISLNNATEVIIPSGVQSLQYGAFSTFSHDEEVVIEIPDSVEFIDGALFDEFWLSSDLVTIRCSDSSYAYEYAMYYGYDVELM